MMARTVIQTYSTDASFTAYKFSGKKSEPITSGNCVVRVIP